MHRFSKSFRFYETWHVVSDALAPLFFSLRHQLGARVVVDERHVDAGALSREGRVCDPCVHGQERLEHRAWCEALPIVEARLGLASPRRARASRVVAASSDRCCKCTVATRKFRFVSRVAGAFSNGQAQNSARTSLIGAVCHAAPPKSTRRRLPGHRIPEYMTRLRATLDTWDSTWDTDDLTRTVLGRVQQPPHRQARRSCSARLH